MMKVVDLAFLLLALTAQAQPRLHIQRESLGGTNGHYVVLGVEDPEITQSVEVEMSTDLVNWQRTDLVHYYPGQGHQTNYATIYEPGSRYFRLTALATNAVFSAIGTADGGAKFNYKLSAGRWALERQETIAGPWEEVTRLEGPAQGEVKLNTVGFFRMRWL
jgi:hypothetical protein